MKQNIQNIVAAAAMTKGQNGAVRCIKNSSKVLEAADCCIAAALHLWHVALCCITVCWKQALVITSLVILTSRLLGRNWTIVLDGKCTKSRNLAFSSEKWNSKVWSEFGRKMGKWSTDCRKKMVKFFYIHWLYHNVFTVGLKERMPISIRMGMEEFSLQNKRMLELLGPHHDITDCEWRSTYIEKAVMCRT